MADITLTANTNYSALSVANGDRILLAGYILTLNANPAQTSVEVTAVGNAGTVALGVPAAYTLTGWILRAGTASLLTNTVSGKSITGCTIYGGSATNINGARYPACAFTDCTIYGGSVGAADGLAGPVGILTNCTIYGGSANNAFGISNPSNLLTGCTAYGGSASGAHGVYNVSAAVRNCAAYGSPSTSGAHGFAGTWRSVFENCSFYGHSSGSHGLASLDVSLNNLLSGVLVDSGSGKAIAAASYHPVIICQGDNIRGAVPSTVRAVLRVGALHANGSISSPTVETEIWDAAGTSGPRLPIGRVYP